MSTTIFTIMLQSQGDIMTKLPGTRLASLASALVTVAGFSAPSIAAPPTGDVTNLVLPAGLACADFDLGIEITANPNRPELREFHDRNGNLVRLLSAGRGNKLVFTNLSSDKTLSLRANGSVSITKINPDGTATVSNTGHNVIVLFPTDVPAGPSTTLYVGRIVYTVDANEVFTVQSVTGTTMDICAALV
jgi:hypothetical protein